MSQVNEQNDDNFQREEENNGIEVLNMSQLNYAREIIAKKRPMVDTHITKVWPWFQHCKWCCKKEKPNFKLALKVSLLNKLDMKIPKSDIALQNDPYRRVGYGINAYFDVTAQLAWMFCIMTLVMLPIMAGFSSMEGVKDFSPMYSLDAYTMGNMGGSSVLCQNVPISVEDIQLSLSCPSGSLNSAALGQDNGLPVFDYGIIGSNVIEKDYCTTASLPSNNPSCMNNFDSSSFESYVSANCNGEKTCSIPNLQSYKVSSTLNPAPSDCFSGSAMLFMQIACTYTDDELSDRQVFGLAQACVGVFLSLFMIVYTDYIASVQSSNYVEWDVKTLTAGDYTVEFDITEEFYRKFQETKGKVKNQKINEEVEFDWDDNKTHAENFRIWIQNQIEYRVSALHDLGYEEEVQDHIDVAVTSLAYDNAELISLLRQRGSLIMAENWDKMREVDEKINQLKQEKIEEWCTPVSCFITFQLEEGIQRALNFEEQLAENEDLQYLNEWFDDETIEIQQASEPSDIIWENRHFTPRERLKKAIIVGIAIFFMLLGSFVVIFGAQKWSYSLMSVYPVVSCNQYDVYPTATLQSLAQQEFIANLALIDNGRTDVTYKGYVQCYCQETVKDTSLSQLSPETVPSELDITDYQQQNICTGYFNNVWFVLAMTNFITVFIVVVNMIIKMIAIELITWIGYDTQSEQLTKITNGVFVSLFFNTGFLLILANANFSGYHLPLQNIFNGPFNDYSPDWYVYVANTLTQTMIINCFVQSGTQIATDVMTWYFRRADQKWAKTEAEKLSTTKCTQVGQYVELFQGAGYIVHFKFSMIFNMVFVTMLYGMGVPALFPIAVLGLVVFWMLERYCVAYTYQVPPSLDDRLTKNAVDLLLVAPMFYIINGFWMLTNTQIFNGWVNQIQRQGDLMVTGHTVGQSLGVNQASPLFLLTLALFIIIILEQYFKEYLTKWGFSITNVNIDVDENLPLFYEAVKLSDADWIVQEQKYYDETYGLKIVEQELADKMDEVGRTTRAISGIAWYNVLANPDYITAFNYIECNVPSRSDLIVDDDDDEDNDNEQSDTVQVALNMGVLNKEVALGMPFGRGMMAYMRDQKKAS